MTIDKGSIILNPADAWQRKEKGGKGEDRGREREKGLREDRIGGMSGGRE